MNQRFDFLRRLRIAAFGVPLLAALALVSAPPVLAQQKMDTIRLADQPGAEVDYAAIWVAELLGYFEK